MNINEEIGELTHSLEQLEINFLKEHGANVNYNDVENHIGRIVKMFQEQFEQNLEMNPDKIENILQDYDDKIDAIESASGTLCDMKRLVQNMNKSSTKETLLSYIEQIEIDLD